MREGVRRLGLLGWRKTAVAGLLAALALGFITPTATQNAVADGETRTLYLYHTHTGETIDATFRVDGHYDANVLHQLNHFLRDWRNNDEIDMDPRLFDAIWEAYRTAGATDRIQIYSAYRSPETNAMLRRRSKAVAEHSQHMLGKAMDTTMPGFPMHRIREAAMKLEHGGVGWYPSANFVHIDVGGVRSWPRMPYDQLMALFPDGKTVHIASNGQTLPGYEEARAELAQRGQTELPPSQEDSGGFFAWLFGGGGSGSGTAHEDEEDRRVAVASTAPTPAPAVQQAQPEPAPEAQAQAAAVPQPQARTEPTAQASPTPPQPPGLAFAPTPQQAQPQPLDAQTQVAAQASLAGQPRQAQPEGTQVASLEPSDGAVAVALPVTMPLPPRRPADLAAVALDIPLPPTRPQALGSIETASLRNTDADALLRRPDAIGRLITATASGLPVMRRSALPALITQGTDARRRAPGAALAFAPSDTISSDEPLDLRPASRAVRAAQTMRPLTALRAGALRHRPASLAVSPSAEVVAASQLTSGTTGPRLTGLRRAAQLRAEKAAL